MKNYKVSFQYSENVFCTNIVIAENENDVNKEYSKYAWVSIKEASNYDVEEAERKGMPIVTIEHKEEKKEEVKEMKEENIIVTFMGYEFVLGKSKKFDADFSVVKNILEKETISSVDRIRLLMFYRPSYHETGKIEKVTSFDSSSTCAFCMKMKEAAKKNVAHICGGCYDTRNEAYRGVNMRNRHLLNMIIMSSVLFTKEELALLAATKINRINSSGETPNETYAMNMINLAFVNPGFKFAYWAKNTKAVSAAIDTLGKPENMTFVQSSPIINRPATLDKNFDLLFTVYLEESDVLEAIKKGSGECNGKKCMECGFKCYLNGWKHGQNIAELARGIGKEKRAAIRKYLENKPIITTGTQKELVDYVSSKYGLTKKAVNDVIRNARKAGLQWDNITVGNMDVTFYLKTGKMYVGEVKAA